MRSSRIICRKFLQFLLPSVLSEMAMSLNEFVDSILVANLIGPEAMTLVNMGMPLMLAFAVIYTLLGIGGSTVYAGHLGKHEKEKADAVFSVTVLAAVLISIMVLILGLAFIDPISWLMCNAREYHEVFVGYAKVLVLSGILIIPMQVIINFMTAFGHPGIGTFLNVVANAVNLVMDYVFIRLFEVGLSGAAYATLTGYLVGFVIILALCLTGKLGLPFVKLSLSDGKVLVEVLSVGVSSAVSQVGYCIKISFSNALAYTFAGMSGTMVFSVCMQAVSMVSVLIGGVIDTMIPLTSSLYGQRDFAGVKNLLKLAALVQFFTNILVLMLFEIWPYGILVMYNVVGDALPLAVVGLRIFSVMFPFRGFVLIYMYYFPAIGRKTYAFVISLVDGFLGLVPLALVLTRINGINGLWQSYSLLSIILVFAILAANFVISNLSGGKYDVLLLLEREEESIPVYESSVKMKSEEISRLSEDVLGFCTREGLDKKLSVITAMAVEEMAVYTSEQSAGTKIEDLDILLKIYPDHVLMDFRSVGRPFDVNSAPKGYTNLAILKKIVTKMECSYVLGMNQTRLLCGTKREAS